MQPEQCLQLQRGQRCSRLQKLSASWGKRMLQNVFPWWALLWLHLLHCRPDVLYGVEERGFADEAQRIVFLHGCHLNEPAVLKRLGSIFRGYEGLEEGPPAAFVLLGPFFSNTVAAVDGAPAHSAADMRHAFSSLVAILSIFRNIQVWTLARPASASSLQAAPCL